MTEQTIKCSKCGAEIPLTEALTGQIEQAIRLKYEADAVVKEKDYQGRLKVVQEQAKALEAKQQAIDEQVAEQVKAERKKIAEAERARIVAEQADATTAMQDELVASKKALAAAEQNELALRQERQKLEEEKQAFELTVQRKMDEERKQIEEKARKQAADEQALRVREKDDKIDLLMKQINDLQRKAEQGSQEAQGEALEGALLDGLRRSFRLMCLKR